LNGYIFQLLKCFNFILNKRKKGGDREDDCGGVWKDEWFFLFFIFYFLD
jgi:hypothetical protein